MVEEVTDKSDWSIFGAVVEWVVWQVMDKYWTNIWHLSNTCPIFVKDLSKSNICQSFGVNVKNLSTFVSICLHSTYKRIFFVQYFFTWTNLGQILVQYMTYICPPVSLCREIMECQIFVKVLSTSQVNPNLLRFV